MISSPLRFFSWVTCQSSYFLAILIKFIKKSRWSTKLRKMTSKQIQLAIKGQLLLIWTHSWAVDFLRVWSPALDDRVWVGLFKEAAEKWIFKDFKEISWINAGQYYLSNRCLCGICKTSWVWDIFWKRLTSAILKMKYFL